MAQETLSRLLGPFLLLLLLLWMFRVLLLLLLLLLCCGRCLCCCCHRCHGRSRSVTLVICTAYNLIFNA